MLQLANVADKRVFLHQHPSYLTDTVRTHLARKKEPTYQESVLRFAIFGVKLNATYKLDGCFVNDLPDTFCE